MRPWLEEVLQQTPQTLQEVYRNRLQLLKSHPVLFRFKDTLYLFLVTVKLGANPYCLVLRLQDSKIVGINVLDPVTNEIRPAQEVDLSKARWNGGAHFAFGHMAEVLESLEVDLRDHNQVYSTLSLLRPAILTDLWTMRSLMEEEWRRHPEISTALDGRFLQQYMQNRGDTLDLLAYFMVAYIVTEK